MLLIKGECPHCSKECGFKMFTADLYSSPKSVRNLNKAQTPEAVWSLGAAKDQAMLYCSGICAECREPVLLVIGVEDCNLDSLRECISHEDKLYRGCEPVILRTYPEHRVPWTHPALPESVKDAFPDLQKMLWQKLCPAYTISGCRTVLETTCKELGGEGKFLANRIDDLKNKGIVTGVLNEWATQIKNFGNEATHDLKGTPEEAEEMVEFTRIFLQYAFELPARIAEIRNKRA